MKKRTVFIIGNGYVGSGMARLFGDHFNVIVHDPAQLRYTMPRVVEADLVLVCVPTPMMANGRADTSIVEAVVSEVFHARHDALVCVKSTVPPGTTDYLNSVHYTFDICFSPEYMGEGKNFVAPWKYPDPSDARSHEFCVVGGEEVAASRVLSFFQRVMGTDARYVMCRAVEAEMAKYMENCYLAMKVAFCNEMYDIAEMHGVSYNKVRDLWLNDSRVDPSHTLVFPDERGFGGKCLPKDLSGMIASAESVGYSPTLLRAIREANAKVRGETDAENNRGVVPDAENNRGVVPDAENNRGVVPDVRVHRGAGAGVHPQAAATQGPDH